MSSSIESYYPPWMKSSFADHEFEQEGKQLEEVNIKLLLNEITTCFRETQNWFRNNAKWTSGEESEEMDQTLELVRALLAAGVDPNGKDRSQDTVLTNGWVRFHPGMAKLFIEAGADVNCKTGYSPPLHMVKHADIARMLIEFGANVNGWYREPRWDDSLQQIGSDSGWEKKTPLHAQRDPDIVRVLIEARGDVNARGEDDQTPLHLIVKRDYLQGPGPDQESTEPNAAIVRMLIEAGADPNSMSGDVGIDGKNTPLGVSGSKETTFALLEYGAKVPRSLPVDDGWPRKGHGYQVWKDIRFWAKSRFTLLSQVEETLLNHWLEFPPTVVDLIKEFSYDEAEVLDIFHSIEDVILKPALHCQLYCCSSYRRFNKTERAVWEKAFKRKRRAAAAKKCTHHICHCAWDAMYLEGSQGYSSYRACGGYMRRCTHQGTTDCALDLDEDAIADVPVDDTDSSDDGFWGY